MSAPKAVLTERSSDKKKDPYIGLFVKLLNILHIFTLKHMQYVVSLAEPHYLQIKVTDMDNGAGAFGYLDAY